MKTLALALLVAEKVLAASCFILLDEKNTILSSMSTLLGTSCPHTSEILAS